MESFDIVLKFREDGLGKNDNCVRVERFAYLLYQSKVSSLLPYVSAKTITTICETA